VSPRKLILTAVCLGLVLALGSETTRADDVEGKWRFGLSLGAFNTQDSVDSASANEMVTIIPCARTSTCTPEELASGQFQRLFLDPRNDSEVFGKLDLNAGPIGTFSVQYGVTKIFVIEASAGYQRSDVGDVEVAIQPFGITPVDPNIDYAFTTERVAVGEIDRVPLQLTALARFRPRATFNPYIGAGLGYAFNTVSFSSRFNQLSVNMDRSRGLQTRLTPAFAVSGPSGNSLVTDGLPQIDLQGATVDVRDSFEWHVAGGAEITLKKKWSLFLDVRWIDASRSISVGFNDSNELGRSVPAFNPFDDTPLANQRYGPSLIGSCRLDDSGATDHNGEPVLCSGGGILDFGRFVSVPSQDATPTTDCKNNQSDIGSNRCMLFFEFDRAHGGDLPPDGVPDGGTSYSKGGTFSYDGLQAAFGVRLTIGK
jgi:outer membrane protein W